MCHTEDTFTGGKKVADWPLITTIMYAAAARLTIPSISSETMHSINSFKNDLKENQAHMVRCVSWNMQIGHNMCTRHSNLQRYPMTQHHGEGAIRLQRVTYGNLKCS